MFNITVIESVGVVRVDFERTGGDLSFPTGIEARTVATAGKPTESANGIQLF